MSRAVYVCDGVRTPFGRYGGALAEVRTDDLAALPLAELLRRNPGMDAAAIDEVMLGCANQAGEDNRNVARMALLLAGIPETVPGCTVNRLCASGLEAIGQAARSIALGEAELCLAGGVESMSRAPFVLAKSDRAYSRAAKLEDTTLGWRLVNPRMVAAFGVDSMTQTAENLASELAISRADQDAFALQSQRRAEQARVGGRLSLELFPVASLTTDEQPRPDTSAERLAALQPILGTGTTITAGNASGINDGAAAVVLASAKALGHHGLEPRARLLGMASAGVPPRVMGVGPVPASRRLLARLGMSLADFDVIEINEAFAAQVLAVTRGLGLPDDASHVNPNGGAIALGHPLGASGARLVLSASLEIARGSARRALVTMCVGVGQGVALALEACD